MNNLTNRKSNGIYYTPINLAEYLVDPLIKKTSKITVFDPAYGEGALLLAAEKTCHKKFNLGIDNYPEFYGCDKAPVNKYLRHLNKSKLIKKDFLEYSSTRKYDLIVTNPPFIRHHHIKAKKKAQYQRIINTIYKLKSTTDVWGYFLTKSLNHLSNNGSIGAILPWSFLQADYATDIRKMLAKNFGKIKVLVLNTHYFNEAEERILLLWLEDYGQESSTIQIGFSKDINQNITYGELDRSKWESSRVLLSSNNDIESIIGEYNEKYEFSSLNDWATIRIGVVTGADEYFIMEFEKAKDHGFSDNHLVPIITSSRAFMGLNSKSISTTKRLLCMPKNKGDKYNWYINKGEEEFYHLRAHSKNRNPWYSVNEGNVPDAFFPYRMGHTPYLVLNDGVTQCTNSIHRVYFNNLSINEKRWMQMSLLSVPGQLSLESLSKTYGSGVLKIEPGQLRNAAVYVSKKPVPNDIYKEIATLIKVNDKISATAKATKLINNALGITKELSKNASFALAELRNQRLGVS